MSSSSSHPTSSPSQAIGPPADRVDKLFKTSKSDIILRAPPPSDSKDRGFVLFPFRSIVLRAASPVFDDILDIPQPAGSPHPPILNIDEDADTVRRFLILVDLTTSRPTSYTLNLPATKALFLFAVKYQVDWLSHDMESALLSHASSTGSIEFWEFAYDHSLWKVLATMMAKFPRSGAINLGSFPTRLRRKMGDDLWDRIVDHHSTTRNWEGLGPTTKMLTDYGADCENWRFPPMKRELWQEGVF